MNYQPDFSDIYDFKALFRAFNKARKAKKGKGGEPAFYLDLEQNLFDLSDALRTRTYRPDPYRYFHLWNKKERLVSEASFRDRVVHHSLVFATEPVFERIFIDQSYACRKGKGSHGAIDTAKSLSRKHQYFLKLDIRHYFDEVDHGVLKSVLAREIADDGILWLCGVLIDAAGVPTSSGKPKGIPIGNLTSQFWANVYLNELDAFVRDELGVDAYLRYMDDMVIFAYDKFELWFYREQIDRFCREKLFLELKDKATVVAPVNEGVPWLGFRVFPGLVCVDRAGRMRFIKKMSASYRRAANDPAEESAEVNRAASLCGHLSTGNTKSLCRSVMTSLDREWFE